MPDRIDTYRRIRERVCIPLAGAEHDYTRWGMKRFVEREALDIYQPDPYWCGGLSETLKIAAYLTTHDLICIPHGHSTPVNTAFSVLQSPIHTPYQEYLVNWNAIHQHLFKDPIEPRGEVVHLPDFPGMCPELDPDKIEREEQI